MRPAAAPVTSRPQERGTDLIGDDVIAVSAVGRQTDSDRLHYKATSYSTLSSPGSRRLHSGMPTERPTACKLIPAGNTAMWCAAVRRRRQISHSQPMHAAFVFARFYSAFSLFFYQRLLV